MDHEYDVEREYHLKCDIKVIRQSYYEIADDRRHETQSVILIPDMEATETARFFTEWLPGAGTVCLNCENLDLDITRIKCPSCLSTNLKTERSEVPTWIPYPVNSPCRMAVMRKNSYWTEHHLFVMTSGVEDELKHMDGRQINLTVLKASEDHLCDTAPSVSRTPR